MTQASNGKARATARITDIPIGPENAITRAQLAALWNCADREARRIIAEFRAQDDGDDMVIVSHSSKSGYYRTNDPETIEWFLNEQTKRARNTFRPLKKARRVLREMRGGNT